MAISAEYSFRWGMLMKKRAFIIALMVSVLMVSGLAFGVEDEDFQKAVDHYKAGRYERAVRVLEEYVKERPEGSAYYLMGYANYALGKHDEAARNFKDAYLVDPEFSPGEFRRAIGIDEAAPPPPAPKAAKGPPVEAEALPRRAQRPRPQPASRPPPSAPRSGNGQSDLWLMPSTARAPPFQG